MVVLLGGGVGWWRWVVVLVGGGGVGGVVGGGGGSGVGWWCWVLGGPSKHILSDHDLQNCQILISLGMLWAGKNTKNHQDTEEKCSLVLYIL